MAEGGFDNENPWLDDKIDHDGNDDDQDDSDVEVDTTQPFKPTGTSTPGPSHERIEMHALPREQSGLPDTSYEESLPLLGDFTHQDDRPPLLEKSQGLHQRQVPKSGLWQVESHKLR